MKDMRMLFWVCCVLYGLCAAFVNAFGVAAPEMRGWLQISETRQGLMLTVQYVGGLLTAAYLALYGERFHKLKTIALGAGALAASSLLLGVLPRAFGQPAGTPTAYLLFLGIWFLGGLGNSAVDLTMNGMIADVYAASKGQRIPVIHTCYGAGAMLVPLLFANGAATDGGAPAFASVYLLIGLLGAAALGFYLRGAKAIAPVSPYADKDACRPRAMKNPGEVFATSRAWLLILIAFLYAAFQVGLTSWLFSYHLERMNMPADRSRYLVSLFFLLALAMRLLTPRLLRRMSPERYYTVFGFSAAACMLAAFLCGQPTLYTALLLLGGFLQGGLVPCFVIIASNAFPTRQSSAASFFLLANSLAGLAAPLAMGAMIERASFSLAMLTIAVCLGLSALLLTLTARKGQRE